MSSPVSPVIANIFLEYFKETAPVPTTWWKRYMDDIFSIVKKAQVDTISNNLNSVNPYIKFTMKAIGNDGRTSFLDTKWSTNSDYTVYTSLYRKLTHPNCYLDWNSNYHISAKTASHALIYRENEFVVLLKSF